MNKVAADWDQEVPAVFFGAHELGWASINAEQGHQRDRRDDVENCSSVP
jgi:hypothetical protein